MTRSQFGCTPAAATPSSSRVVFVITLVGALVMGACGHARQKATEEVERLNRAALADFKKGKLQDARKGLLEAVRVGKAGEVEPALLARSHLALGAVYAGQPKDADKAIAHMAAALERDPAIKLPKTLATPAARKALGAARRGEKGGAEPTAKPRAAEPVVAAAPPPKPQPAEAPPAAIAPPPVAPAAPPAPVAARPEPAPGRLTQPLSCRVPEEAPPENEIMFRCAVRGDARVSKVLLHYRPAGSELFTEVPMARNKRGWYTGVAPASATAGKMLQYWVEGRGATPVSNGTSESPNLILVREGAAPAGPDDPVPGRTPADDDDDDERPSSVNEDPLAAIARERELARDREGRNRRDAGNVFVAFGFGSGFGWQPGGSLEFRDDQKVDPGPLPGGLVHLLPEVGYQLSDDFAVSLQARLQFLPAQGAGDPKAGSPQEKAFAALVRAVWAFGPANLRGFFSGCAGAGDGFRLRVPADRGVGLIRSDTVRGGPLLAGAGAGVAYHISQHLAWSTELRALVGLPTVAAIAELSTGLEVGF